MCSNRKQYDSTLGLNLFILWNLAISYLVCSYLLQIIYYFIVLSFRRPECVSVDLHVVSGAKRRTTRVMTMTTRQMNFNLEPISASAFTASHNRLASTHWTFWFWRVRYIFHPDFWQHWSKESTVKLITNWKTTMMKFGEDRVVFKMLVAISLVLRGL